MPVDPPIIVDWGTTNFRAYRFAGGAVAETRHAPAGILSVRDSAFEAVLEREIGDWIGPGSTIMLSGMITSRNGWLETPYVKTPATLADLAANTRHSGMRGGARLRFLPGVCMRAPRADVMRGEEIQVFGVTEANEDATVVLPGTHSKWVEVAAGRLVAFRTFFTGEMFALLRSHSIIGKVASDDTASPDAFAAGVKQALAADSSGVLNDIFSVRAGVLLGIVPAGDVGERLSGILIGHEVRAGLATHKGRGTIRLVGDAALCALYRHALEIAGAQAEIGPEQATVAGFQKLAALEG